MALTGKTIGQLTFLAEPTSNTLIPVELTGTTYHIAFSAITGNTGTSGSSGSSGTSGTSGSSGSSGTSGSDGSSGTSGSSGTGGMTYASGFVNAGDYITLGNLKARIPSSGNRSLQVATVSGTYSVIGSNIYSQTGSVAGSTISSSAPLSITTTPTYLNAGNSFGTSGSVDTWTIMDYVNFIGWRISVVIGPSYNANLITIERIY